MNHQLFVIATIVALLSAVNIHAKAVPENQDELRAVSSGINQFAADFYKSLAESENGNLISSPLSLSMVLAMLTYGARGTTEEKLRSALRLPLDDTRSKNGFQSLVDSLNNAKKVELRLSNKIFANNGFTLKPEFQAVTENTFRSVVQSLDFSKADVAAQTINSWAAETTNNKIKEIVTPADVQSAAVVLANAVYFKGNWKKPFDQALTKPQPFNVDASTIKDVETMHKLDYFNYGVLPQLKARFVELPYESEDESDQLSMIIILPDEIDGLKNVESNIDKVNFAELNGYSSKVNLFLPKFKIEKTFDLGKVLKKVGVEDIFEDSANFSGITDGPLKISKVVQKAYINVDEKGSEAAAVTGVVGVTSLPAPPVPIITFKADKPFIYAIVHGTSKAILFQGHVTSPVV